MKNCHALFGWSQRDSRRYRFAVPNAVWKYQLRPAEFVIFSYLCYHYSCKQAGSVTPEIIAKGVRVTADTVKKHLTALVNKVLVNEDVTPALKCKGEKFFTLPNEIFLLRLPHSAFEVYAYLLLIEDRRTHTCQPSYNTLAAETGLSKNTVLKSVSVLVEMELIMVEPSSYFDQRGMKWKGNNLYTILPIRIAMSAFCQRQLRQLELDAKRGRIRKQQEEYSRRRPTVALCTAPATRAALEPIPGKQASVWPSEGACEGPSGAPTGAQRSGSGGERRSGGMSELCRLRRSEGYGARDDEKQDKRRTPQAAPAKTTSARSAGS